MAKITKVPDGPLIKKKGKFKGSTLKNGGAMKKKAQIGMNVPKPKTGETTGAPIGEYKPQGAPVGEYKPQGSPVGTYKQSGVSVGTYKPQGASIGVSRFDKGKGFKSGGTIKKGVSLSIGRGEKSKAGGLTAKGVAKYNRATGGKMKTAVTTKPSKLKPGSKAANRRKSFCARMSGVKGPAKKPNGEPTRKTLALRKWNC
jgi:hypothetical protein